MSGEYIGRVQTFGIKGTSHLREGSMSNQLDYENITFSRINTLPISSIQTFFLLCYLIIDNPISVSDISIGVGFDTTVFRRPRLKMIRLSRNSTIFRCSRVSWYPSTHLQGWVAATDRIVASVYRCRACCMKLNRGSSSFKYLEILWTLIWTIGLSFSYNSRLLLA